MQKVNDLKADQLRKDFGDDFVDKVTASALGKTVSKLQTYVSKEIRQKYNIKAADVKRHAKKMKLIKGHRNFQKASILYKGRSLSFMDFGAREKRVTLGRKTKKGRPWGRFRNCLLYTSPSPRDRG